MIVIGISGLYHDSAAAIVKDGEILAAAQEERFTRVKHDNSLPYHAIDYCLEQAGIKMFEADAVVYYDQPMLTLDRYVRTIRSLGTQGEYLREKLFKEVVPTRLVVDSVLRKRYGVLGREDKLITLMHHLSHASSAFYPSPFDSAALLTVDGVGEWTTTAIGRCKGTEIEILREIRFPHSIGLMYSAFTGFCGFKVNSGEYKLMGLAPYGDPVYYDMICEKLIDISEDGSYRLNMEYFDFHKSGHMVNEAFERLFGGPARKPESRITKREMDMAASVQKVMEEVMLKLARTAKVVTGEENLVMAGGSALNCVANGIIKQSGIFKNLWIQPASDDAGGALGCALYAYYKLSGSNRVPDPNDSQKGSYLGPGFTNEDIKRTLDKENAVCHQLTGEKLCEEVAKLLADNKVVGWFQGRMEFGPRALGNRSILANPCSENMQSRLNKSIKFRESFRPFAPAVLLEDAKEYFEIEGDSPYMLLVSDVVKGRRCKFDKGSYMSEYDGDMLPLINATRSDIPAVTHIDYSARVQTVTKERNGVFYELLKSFKEKTGYGILINTSFNVRGEPIVCTPEDAYRCFMKTGMDVLVMGDYILYKDEQ